ncbi:MAG TPA: YfaZ family outer membrane protein [Steroidobacteraceae bacterium]|nr:YfaZ family outer membrane protein [Steroidobacteraceae bacterium]
MRVSLPLSSLTLSALLAVTAALPLPLRAQEPLAPGSAPAIEGFATNYTLQTNLLTAAPFRPARSDLDYGLLIGDPHNLVASAAWMFHTNIEVQRYFTFEVGPKAYMAMLAEQNRGVLSVAIGGDARLLLVPRMGISLFGSAYYAPSVFMFGSANNLYDLTAGLQVPFAHRLSALAGYRWFRYSLENSADDTVENNVFVGLRWDFARPTP